MKRLSLSVVLALCLLAGSAPAGERPPVAAPCDEVGPGVIAAFKGDSGVPATRGAEYYVATTGDDGTGDGSAGNPWRHIQYAHDQAANGDTIHVAAGTYNEQLSITKGVKLEGAGAATTIVDGAGLTSSTNVLINLPSGAGTCTFTGFTVRNVPVASSSNRYLLTVRWSTASGTFVVVTHSAFEASAPIDEYWGVCVGGLADVVVNYNTFTDFWGNAVLVERALNDVELGYNTFDMADDSGPAIWSMSYKNPGETDPYTVTGHHYYHHNVITTTGPTGLYGGIGVASAWGTAYGQRTDGSYTNLEVAHNVMGPIEVDRSGLDLMVDGDNGGFPGARVTCNTITGIGTPALRAGMRLYGAISGVTIAGNDIHGFFRGLLLTDSYGHGVFPSGNTIRYNDFAGNTIGLRNDGTSQAVAEKNWWGTTNATAIGTYVSGSVDYTPFLLSNQVRMAFGGNRLADKQYTDGAWGWPLDAPPTYGNILGPITLGLAKAYRATNDPDLYAALLDARAYLLTKTNNFSPSDGYLAAELDRILGGTTCVAHVTTNFYGPLAAGTYNRNGAGTLYSTATYVDLIQANRHGGGIGNLAAWDIGMGLVAAASCGVAPGQLDIWIAGVEDEINLLDGDAYYDVIGLAGGLYGLAFVDEEFDPTAGEHAAAGSLADLADILASYQIAASGGFAWNSNYVTPYDYNEVEQETAYAILALEEVGGFASTVAAAQGWLLSVQLSTGGWGLYNGVPAENNEVTGEAMWGIWNAGPATLTLVPDDECYTTGETVTVELWMNDIIQAVVGGQFFLQYDQTLLDFVSAVPGEAPFTAELWEVVNESLGTIDYSVNAAPGDPGVAGTKKMAVLTFTALGPVCAETGLITWRPHNPPTRLSTNLGQAVYPDLVAMDVLDDVAPVITGLTATGGAVDGACEYTVTFSATVTDNCCLDPDDIVVDVALLTANATLGTPSITKTPVTDGYLVSGTVLVSDLTSCPATVRVTVYATDCCGNQAGGSAATPDSGFWTESFVGGAPGAPGNVVEAWDTAPGVAWHLAGPTLQSVTLVSDGVVGGNGVRVYDSLYTGGTLTYGVDTVPVLSHRHLTYQVWVGGAVDWSQSYTDIVTHAVGYTITGQATFVGQGATAPSGYPAVQGSFGGHWGAIADLLLTQLGSVTADVVDEIDPVITCPADVTIECDESTDPSNTGQATATDNCDGSPDVSFSDVYTAFSGLTSPGGWLFFSQKTASGAFVTGPATPTAGSGSFHVVTGPGDPPAPPPASGAGGKSWLATFNHDGTLLSAITTFAYSTYVASAGSPSITSAINLYIDLDGNGTRDTTFVFEPVYVVTQQGPIVPGVWQTWDTLNGPGWWYTANGGYPAQLPNPFNEFKPLSYYIALFPNAKIVTWGGAPGLNVVTGQNSSGAPWHNYDGYVDNVLFNAAAYDFEPGAGVCSAVIRRTWTAEDACDNSSMCVQTITVVDTTPPVISPVASNQTVECDGAGNTAALATWLASHGGAAATDNCGAVTWSYTPNPAVLSDDCCAAGEVTVTFRATDACGNYSETTATFTVEDTTVPTITTSAANLTVQCDGAGNTAELNAWLASHGGAAATDVCCDGDIVWTDNFSGLSDLCCATGAATVTFTATDGCGNFSTTTATFTIQDTLAPTVSGCPANITVDAEAGDCSAVVTWTEPTASDVCCGPVPWTTRSHAPGDNFPQGTTTVTYTFTDVCGNTATCVFTVTVNGVNNVSATVGLVGLYYDPVPGNLGTVLSLTRCVTFEVWSCSGAPVIVPVPVTFTITDGVVAPAAADFTVPCGAYTCITARDTLHTLRRTAALADAGTVYTADFTGGDALVGGNLNGDFWVDILDFGVFSWQWATNYGSGDTTCSTPFPHADISGSGIVWTEDFTFIQVNYLDGHEDNCCGAPGFRGDEEGGSGPLAAVAVADLPGMGLSQLSVADLNADGWLDEADIAAFLMGARPVLLKQEMEQPVEVEVTAPVPTDRRR